MSEFNSLKGHFLLSMPHMQDPFFSHSLTYLIEHDAEGAMGIIINRPLDVELSELLAELDIEMTTSTGMFVYAGGPVAQERGFILHRSNDQQHWQSSIALSSGVSLTSSKDILQAIADGEGPPDGVIVALGYSGWQAGQLEQEILGNSWLSCPADLDIMFSIPAEDRLQAAASSMGIDLNLLTSHAGNA